MLMPLLLCVSAVLPPPLLSQDADGPAPAARAVLERALDAMESGSLKREEIDWEAFRADVMERAADAETVADTWPVLEHALEALGDGHSFLIRPGGSNSYVEEARDSFVDPSGEWLEQGYALVRVPGYLGGTGAEDDLAFARKLRHVIVDLDANQPKGWIVDLRGDTGGNMWPMLLGIGPVLGDGHCGSFVGPGGNPSRWFHEAGSVGIGGNTFMTFGEDAYELASPDPHVAVLTGPDTASSGEAVTAAFRGRPKTRSFGAGTAGVSTANDMVWLGENTLMFLCVARNADRTGTVYGGVIEPDVPVEAGEEGDAVLDAAVAWLDAMTEAGAPADR